MIQVTAAVLREGDRVLIARRAPGQRMAGLWEFPGGKVDPGETPEAALAREIREELSLDVAVGARLDGYRHDYSHASIELLFYAVARRGGELRLVDHDRAEWVPVPELLRYEFAPADVPFVKRTVAAAGGAAGPEAP